MPAMELSAPLAVPAVVRASRCRPVLRIASRFEFVTMTVDDHFGELPASLESADRAILALGTHLSRQGYKFTTISPASHYRVRARLHHGSRSLQDVLGWSVPFSAHDLAPGDLQRLTDAGILQSEGSFLRAMVRFSTLDEQLFVHSSFPTEQPDAVFFGPDTYRFARFINPTLDTVKLRNSSQNIRILDVCAGSGAGGLHAAGRLAELRPNITLSDVNQRALDFCRINATFNAVPNVTIVESDLFERVGGPFDLIIANPPYLVDRLARTYRHGGGALGSELSLRIAAEGLSRLAPGGRLLLYTGSPIVNGSDRLHAALLSRLEGYDVRIAYEEIDPDVFGEELEHPPYDHVDRLAVVGVTIDID
jgi:release factor glutamine methyltransferase